MYMYFNTASLNNKLLTDRSRVYSELQWGGGGGGGVKQYFIFYLYKSLQYKGLDLSCSGDNQHEM